MIICNIDEFNKCEICIESKMTRQPFHSVERNTNLLDLVHSEICEVNSMLTGGGNRDFIIFIEIALDIHTCTYLSTKMSLFMV